MARKSRKDFIKDENTNVKHVYKVAIYSRLSVKNNNKKDNNDDTIENQINIIKDFIKTQDDMEIYKVFSDNGYTGTNYDRPSFQAMMEDMIAEKFDCIIVKDLSRLGRDYIATGHYIEQTFPFYNIRFISLKEGKDSAKIDDSSAEFMVGVTNITNNLYSKETSVKVFNVFDNKLKAGECMGHCPYGYRRSETEKNRLVIDEEVADNVRRIFKLRLTGMSFAEISRNLNRDKIIPPTLYRNLKANINNQSKRQILTTWQPKVVNDIVNNLIYTGDKVERKSMKSYAKGIEERRLKKDEFKIIKKTHKAIIDKKIFNAVQKINEKNKNTSVKKNKNVNIFKGILRCKECGATMKQRILVNSVNYYCCYSNINRGLDNCCTSKTIQSSIIEDVILEQIRINIELSIDLNNKLLTWKNNKSKRKNQIEINKNIKSIDAEIQKIDSKKLNLFEQYANDEISEDLFLTTKAEFDNVEEMFLQDKQALLIELDKENLMMNNHNQWIDSVLKYQKVEKLDRMLLDELVEVIYVTREKEIEIIWKFQDNFKQLTDKLGGIIL